MQRKKPAMTKTALALQAKSKELMAKYDAASSANRPPEGWKMSAFVTVPPKIGRTG